MGLLANFKIRTKVLIALLPLAIMVIVAALYSSDQMSKVDARYSGLIDHDINARQAVTVARVMNNRFGQLLYKEIAEPDLDRMQVIDAELDETVAEFRSSVDEARRESPTLAPAISAATAMFDQAISDSRPIRAAAQAQNKGKAMKLLVSWKIRFC